MRIYFHNAYYPLNRFEGSRVHIEQLTRHLIAQGHEVWTSPYSPASHTSKLSKNRIKKIKQIMSMDVIYVRAKERPFPPFPNWMRNPWRRTLFNKPVVWEINAAPDLAALQNESIVLSDLDREFRKQAQIVDLAICNTDGLAQYAKDLGIRKSITIPLASDPDIFNPKVTPTTYILRKSNKLNVVWCGNTKIPWHDFDLILRVAEKLHQVENIRFYIIGSYPKGIKFPDNITFFGEIPYSDMPSYLTAMDVGLALYKKCTWSRYGVFSSPLKLFDYLSVGLTVICTPIEQVTKCIDDGKTGFVIPFDNDEALGNRLKLIAEDKRQIKKIAKRSRKLVLDYYNWKRVAAETAEALKQIV